MDSDSPVPPSDRALVPPLQPGWKRLLQWPFVGMIRKFLVLPLIATLLSVIIVGRVVNSFIGPQNYYVYMVGDENDKSVNAMLQAAAGKALMPLAGVPVTAETRDDSGDPEQAWAIAQEL